MEEGEPDWEKCVSLKGSGLDMVLSGAVLLMLHFAASSEFSATADGVDKTDEAITNVVGE